MEIDNYEVYLERHPNIKSTYLDSLNKYVIILTLNEFKRVKVDPFLGNFKSQYPRPSDYEEARKKI